MNEERNSFSIKAARFIGLAHDQALRRDLALINRLTIREFGPFPPGGVPIVAKRKPNLSRVPSKASAELDGLPRLSFEALESKEECTMIMDSLDVKIEQAELEARRLLGELETK